MGYVEALQIYLLFDSALYLVCSTFGIPLPSWRQTTWNAKSAIKAFKNTIIYLKLLKSCSKQDWEMAQQII